MNGEQNHLKNRKISSLIVTPTGSKHFHEISNGISTKTSSKIISYLNVDLTLF